MAELERRLVEAEAKLQSAEQYRVGLDKLSKSHQGLRKQLLQEKATRIAQEHGAVDTAVLGLLPLDEAWGENDQLDEEKIRAKIAEHKTAHPKLYAEQTFEYLPPMVGSAPGRAPDPLGEYAAAVASGRLTAEQAKAFRAAQQPNGATSVSRYSALTRKQ